MATIKQKKALDNVVGNGGNVTQAMIDAGYSENTANTPQKLTESKGWKELMDEYLPDSLLASKHKELLNKIDDKGQIDVQAVKAGLDMAYKINGSYAPEKKDITTMGEKLPNTDLDALAEMMTKQLKDDKI